MARKFLWVVVILTIIVLLLAIGWRLFAGELVRFAFVPTLSYAESPVAPAPDYSRDAAWVARPGMTPNPARWTPPGHSAAPRAAAVAFHIPPTAWLSRSRWNAPLDDAETNERLDRFTKMQASVFNGVADIWVPRYRQATFGAFLSDNPAGDEALDLAFGDVQRAFAAFLAANPGDGPIILSGHSQGARHLLHLLNRLDPAVSRRIVAVYAIGWSVALPGDLALVSGIPPCTGPEQAGCLLSWMSYSADGDLKQAVAALSKTPALDGSPVGTRKHLCTNPLTGGAPGKALAERNLGTLIGEELQPARAGAECSADGLLLIDPTPRDVGPFVLPGGNFHVYDYGLFWANIRADAEARLSAFGAARMPAAAVMPAAMDWPGAPAMAGQRA